jgi:hypothetical protein
VSDPRAIVAAALVLIALAAGCRVFLWAGDHELAIPPLPEPTPSPTTPGDGRPLK